ncbi:hypothetical protein LJR231_002216 [Phyllobacterium sp. LjRoot231]
MHAKPEFGHNTEVAAPAAYAPKQVWLGIRAALNQLAISSNNIGRQQVIDCQAKAAAQPSHASAQGQPGNARMRHQARWGCEASTRSGCIQMLQECATTHFSSPCDGINDNFIHRRQVEHDAIVACRQTWQAMATTSDGEQNLALRSNCNGFCYVSHILRTHDGGGPPVRYGIPYFSVVIIVDMTRTQHRAIYSRFFEFANQQCCFHAQVPRSSARQNLHENWIDRAVP